MLQSQEALATASTESLESESNGLAVSGISPSAQTAASSAGQHADPAQKRVLDDSASANGSLQSYAPQ